MYKLLIISLIFGISIKVVSQNETSLITWSKYQEDFPSDKYFKGFSLTFLYPKTIDVLDVVDNCRCVGKKIKDPAFNETNLPFWCICLTDTTFSIENEIKAYKSNQKSDLVEKRDSVMVSDKKVLRITLMKFENEFLVQFIYLKKYGTLFEITNKKDLSKDFERFLNSIRIDKDTNYTR